MIEQVEHPQSGTRAVPIRIAARRSGLSPALVRAWERRYGAVQPIRSPTRRRLYTEKHIRRLELLRSVVAAGHRIGDVAQLDDQELRSLSGLYDEAARVGSKRPNGRLERVIEDCLEAIEGLDAPALERALEGSIAVVGRNAFASEVLVPMMTRVGQAWREGELRVMHEHLATAVVRSVLAGLREDSRVSPGAPVLVVTTPAGQQHELGALSVANAATSAGWRAAYLGPDVPAEDIAAAARQLGAKAVALSLVYAPDGPRVSGELWRLRRLLSPDTALIVGGPAARRHALLLDELRALTPATLPELRDTLDSLRPNDRRSDVQHA
jgi:DNA-binding transcriptional MerR regulator/methylmalonyl-CoA mutase cobalamin-binding subunit